MASDREFAASYKRDINRKKDHLIHRVFPAPAGCKAFNTIVIRELDGVDERIAALRTDEVLKQYKEPTMALVLKIQHQEAVRLSIAAVDGVSTSNDLGSPFSEFDRWTQAVTTVVARFYSEVNGIGTDDMEKAVADSKPVDPSRLNETPNFDESTEGASTETP
jgi:hypothetical protein